jgi:hypothetical protein
MTRIVIPGSRRLCLTTHAQERMKQRNITISDLTSILTIGIPRPAGYGRTIRYIPENPFFVYTQKISPALQGLGLIESRDGTIITVMWKEDR